MSSMLSISPCYSYITYVGTHLGLPHNVLRSHGTHMGLTWYSHGTHMVLTWDSHGTHMVLTWNSHGTHMGLTWYSHGTHMGLTLYSHGTHIEAPSFVSAVNVSLNHTQTLAPSSPYPIVA